MTFFNPLGKKINSKRLTKSMSIKKKKDQKIIEKKTQTFYVISAYGICIAKVH